jgi:hypothetical protein
MGLDMALIVKRTLLNDFEYDAQAADSYNKIIKTVDRANLMRNSEYAIMRIELEVMHWRRFYPLHEWFINNGIKSDSEGAHYYVTPKKLELLVDILDQIVNNNDEAPKLLPADNYDEWYYEAVTRSRDVLRELSASIKTERLMNIQWNVYYIASW